jgi:gliding motility-associated-like protein
MLTLTVLSFTTTLKVGKFLRSATVTLLLISCYFAGYSQGSTSKGTEFWTAFMANTNPPGGTDGSVMVLYVTSDVTTSVSVSIAGGFAVTYGVIANQVTTITIDPNAYLGAAGKSKNSIHITSLKPVAVFAHIYANNSSGATLLLPVSAMGKDYQSINYTQNSDINPAYSAFLVVATEDSTAVELTIKAVALGGGISTKIDTITLNKGEVYQVLKSTDLTGSRIRSISSGANTCKKIAVFSGSTRIYIGCNLSSNASSDNLFQQAYPTTAWGTNYITIPLKNRNYDIFRVVLSDPNTNLSVGGNLVNTSAFTNGLYYEFKAQQPTIITADKPVQVVQYAVTQGNTFNCGTDLDDIGDPEMIFLTPMQQTLDHVTLYSASKYKILANYINVIIKVTETPTFLLDGVHQGFYNIPNGGAPPIWAYAQFQVNSGPHTLSAGDGFSAIAYGFGQDESYGYAAGANLQDLNSHIDLENPQTNALQKNGCSGIGYNLQLTLPYQTTSIKWDFGNGKAFTQSNPTLAGTSTNGSKILYIYNYPKNPVSFNKGDYSLIATALNPVADECGSLQQIELDFTISDPPVADFKVDNTTLGYGTPFIDETTFSTDIKTWAWDFGDNQTSVDENPVHAYAQPGSYNVSLTVTDVDGCTSFRSKTVMINITASSAVGAVAACKGQASISPNIQQFSVAGINLSSAIIAAAPQNFELSLNKNSNYASSITINPTGGTVTNVQVYVRSAATAPLGHIAGDVVMSLAGSPIMKVAVAGGVNDLPTMNQVPSQIFYNGKQSTPINFTGTSNTFDWVNDTPGIGLPATGTNNIAPFIAVNTGSSPVKAKVIVTPVSASLAYITNSGLNSVSVISTVSKALIESIPVGTAPYGLSVSPDASLIYVANFDSNNISVINTSSNTVIATIAVGLKPFSVAVSPDGKRVYTANYASNTVSVIDATTDKVTASIKVGVGPQSVVVSPDGSNIYVANFSSATISVINTANNTVTSTIHVGAGALGVAVSPDGASVYVANEKANSVSVINASSAAVEATVPVGSNPIGVTIGFDGSRMYVSNSQDNTVSVINTITNLTIATIPVGLLPTGMSVSPDGNYIYVSNQAANSVSVIDAATNTVLSTFNAGTNPYSMCFTKGSGCGGAPVSFDIVVNPTVTPTIIASTVTGSTSGCAGTASASPDIEQFTVSGANLTADLVVAASNNFEVSSSPGSGYAGSLTVLQSGGVVNNTIIYVRSAASAPAGNISGDVSLTSAGVLPQKVPVTGTINASPTINLITNQSVNNGMPTTAVNFTGTGDTYNWLNDAPGIGLAARGTGEIPSFTAVNLGASPVVAKITVTPMESGSGCSGIPGYFTITVYPASVTVISAIVIPNTFTPNGDGVNDIWDIKFLNSYANCSVDVFSRYGKKIYSSIGYGIPWNGTYRGEALPAGTYYYIINLKNGMEPLSGFVAIIR